MEQKNQDNNITTKVQSEIRPINMDKSTLLIILLLFIFSSKLWDIAWDIGKSILYIIIIMYLINFVNQDWAIKIKEIINDFMNVDSYSNFITELLSKLSIKVIDFLKKIKQEQETQTKPNQEQPKQEQPKQEQAKQEQANQDQAQSQAKPKQTNLIEKFNANLRTNLFQSNGSIDSVNTKNLFNLPKSSNKNIYF